MPGDQFVVTVWVAPGDDDDDDDGDGEPSEEDTYQTLRRTFESGTISVIARQDRTDGILRQEMQMKIEPDETFAEYTRMVQEGEIRDSHALGRLCRAWLSAYIY